MKVLHYVYDEEKEGLVLIKLGNAPVCGSHIKIQSNPKSVVMGYTASVRFVIIFMMEKVKNTSIKRP